MIRVLSLKVLYSVNLVLNRDSITHELYREVHTFFLANLNLAPGIHKAWNLNCIIHLGIPIKFRICQKSKNQSVASNLPWT